MPFAITKARYKKWFNYSVCNGENSEVGDCMKQLISIIMNLNDDIWLNAWKRSGLIAEYLSELDRAESEIKREEITFEEDIELLSEEDEPERQKEQGNQETQEQLAENVEFLILDDQIPNTQKKNKTAKTYFFF